MVRGVSAYLQQFEMVAAAARWEEPVLQSVCGSKANLSGRSFTLGRTDEGHFGRVFRLQPGSYSGRVDCSDSECEEEEAERAEIISDMEMLCLNFLVVASAIIDLRKETLGVETRYVKLTVVTSGLAKAKSQVSLTLWPLFSVGEAVGCARVEHTVPEPVNGSLRTGQALMLRAPWLFAGVKAINV
ncbi:hypothetical protein MHYP_G00222980 [Metynnis hypsauchen]